MVALAQVYLKLHPDGTGLGKETDATVRKATASVKGVKVPLVIDTSQPDKAVPQLNARLAALSKAVSERRSLNVDGAAAQAVLARVQTNIATLGKQVDVKVGAQGLAKTEAQLLGLEAQFNRLGKSEDRTAVKSDSLGRALGRTAASFAGASDASTLFSGEAGIAAKAMAAVSLSTGVLEPLIAGAVVTVGALGSAFAAVGVGVGVFATIASQEISKVTDAVTKYQAAQQQAQKATTAAGKASAEAAKQDAFKGLNSTQVAFAHSLIHSQNLWDRFLKSVSPGVLGVASKGLALFPQILSDIRPILPPIESALGTIIHMVAGGLGSTKFMGFLQNLGHQAKPDLIALAHIIANIGRGFGGIVTAFTPASHSVLQGIQHLTAAFAKWGQGLQGHSGFHALLQEARQYAGPIAETLKNLAEAIALVASDLAGSHSLVPFYAAVLPPLTHFLTTLIKANPELVQFAAYALAGGAALGKIGRGITGVSAGFQGLKAAGGVVTALLTKMGLLAAATTAETGEQVALDGAMDANPIGLVVVAIAALAAGLVYAYTHSATFRAIVQDTFSWIKGHWPLLLGILLGPVGIAIAVIIKNWHAIRDGAAAVINWIRGNWKLLLSILGGPVVAAVLLITGHLHQISAVAHTVFGAVTGFVQTAVKTIANIWLSMVLVMLGAMRGLLGFMGHLPGPLGAPFRAASKAIDGAMAKVEAYKTKLNSIPANKTTSLVVHGDGSFFVKGVTNKGPLQLAAGGRLPGFGGGDRRPALLEDGETVVDKYASRSPAMVAAFRAHGVPGYAAGGRIGGLSAQDHFKGTAPGLGTWTSDEVAKTNKMLTGAVAAATAKAVKQGLMGGGGSGGPLVAYLRQFVGRTPYVWGGTSTTGWDCSGMVENALSTVYGISAPRTSEGQYSWATKTKDLPGAMVFFVSPAGGPPPGHVGISMGNGSMINAAGRAFGTIISGTGGNMGFGVPPGGYPKQPKRGFAMGTPGAPAGWAKVGERGMELVHFHGGETVLNHAASMAAMAGGGPVAGYAKGTPVKKGGPNKKELAELARDVARLGRLQKHAVTFRKAQRHFIDVEQLWMLQHPHARSGAKLPHERALAGLQRQLRSFNKREGGAEGLLTKEISLLRNLTGYPRGKRYGGPGGGGGQGGGGDGGGAGGGGDTGGGGSSGGGPTGQAGPTPAWLLPYVAGGTNADSGPVVIGGAPGMAGAGPAGLGGGFNWGRTRPGPGGNGVEGLLGELVGHTRTLVAAAQQAPAATAAGVNQGVNGIGRAARQGGYFGTGA